MSNAGDESIRVEEFMLLVRLVVWSFSVGIMVSTAGMAAGQSYPNKAVRIVTAEPGGANDFMARVIAQGLTGNWGQQVVVENRGGNVAIAAEFVAKAPPDGYTLLLYGSVIWIAPLLRNDMPYDPVRDLSPITLPVSSPAMLVVHPSLPVKSVKELIALAKARPGELNIATGITGSTSHLAAELFKAMAGVKAVSISYRGNGPAFNALIGGQVHMMFPTAGVATPHRNSGRLRALAVTSAQPSALFPGLPTVAASGVPGYESVSIVGTFAPARTPEAIINRLNQEIVRVLNTTDVKDRFLKVGVETVGSSPEQLAAMVKSDMARMGKLIRDAGIRGE